MDNRSYRYGREAGVGDPEGDFKMFVIILGSLFAVILIGFVLQRGGELFSSGQVAGVGHRDTPARIPVPSRNDVEPLAGDQRRAPLPRPGSGPRTETAAYRWIDSRGTLHFTDYPGPPGSRILKMAPIATYDFPEERSLPKMRERLRQLVAAQRSEASTRSRLPSAGEVTATRISRDQFETTDGYHINANAHHFGPSLSFEGRISGGPRCGTLRLKAWLQDSNGNGRRFVALAHNLGSGSRLFESREQRVNRVKHGWEVSSVTVSCLDRQ